MESLKHIDAQKFYLDYVNNYLPYMATSNIAEDWLITPAEARLLIDIGRLLNLKLSEGDRADIIDTFIFDPKSPISEGDYIRRVGTLEITIANDEWDNDISEYWHKIVGQKQQLHTTTILTLINEEGTVIAALSHAEHPEDLMLQALENHHNAIDGGKVIKLAEISSRNDAVWSWAYTVAVTYSEEEEEENHELSVIPCAFYSN